MWYMIRTVKGEEQQVCTWINQRMDSTIFNKCFIPLYEDVWRKEGIGNISIRKMFDGYLFIETDRPKDVYEKLRNVPKLTILITEKDQTGKCFWPIHKEEEEFLDNVLWDGLMRVSYIERNANGRITFVAGPLADYQEYIVKIDLPHRRAIVEMPFLGEKRRLKFGLWSSKDPMIPWLEEAKKRRLEEKGSGHSGTDTQKDVSHGQNAGQGYLRESGITEGDYVVNTTGIYGDGLLKVISVDEKRRRVTASVPLLGELIPVQMSMDDVEKEERRKVEDEGSSKDKY